MFSNVHRLWGGHARTLAVENCSLSSAKDAPDDSLIERIASGDKRAMSLLYARHHVRIFRFALRFVGDEMLAEDLVSETFLDVWQKARTFEGRSQVSTWLLAIARYKALASQRRRSTDTDEDAWESIEDASDNPEKAIEKKQKNEILINCLAKLSPPHREIIDLVYYHEKSIDEVANIICVPHSTVKTRMFYARQRLAELVRAQGIVTALA